MDNTINCARLISCHPQGSMLRGLICRKTEAGDLIEAVSKNEDLILKNSRIEIPKDVQNVYSWFSNVILEFEPQQYLFDEANRMIEGTAKKLRKKYSSLIKNLRLDEWSDFDFLKSDEVHTGYKIIDEGKTIAFEWKNFRVWYSCKSQKFMGINETYFQMFSVIIANEEMIECVEQFADELKESPKVKDCSFEADYTKFKINLTINYGDCTAFFKISPSSYRKDLTAVYNYHKEISKEN